MSLILYMPWNKPVMLLIIRLLIPVLVSFANPLHSQELSYKKYGVKDGLPSVVVYHAVQDKKGFMWFATNRGVSRFDGKVFTNFSKEDGLPDNEILKLYVDKDNNIWFISFIGTPSVFHNGAIHQINVKGVFAITEDPVENLILLFSRQVSANGDENFGYYRSLNKPGSWKFSSHFISVNINGTSYPEWPVLRASGPEVRFYYSFINSNRNRLLVKTRKAERSFLFGDTIFSPFTTSSFTSITANKRGVVFHTADTIYHADINSIQPLIYLGELGLNVDRGRHLNFIFCENDSTTWLCTKNKGLIRIVNFMSPSRHVKHYFSKNSCSSILKDHENGYWITTLEEGVYYVPNLDFFNLADRPGDVKGSVKCIRSLDQGRLGAGFGNGTILTIDLKTLQTDIFSKWTSENKNNRVIDIWPYPGNRLVVASDLGLYMHSSRQVYNEIISEGALKGVYINPDSSILSGTSMTVRLTHPAKKQQEIIHFNRATCVAAIGKNYFWGTLNGAYAFVNDSTIFLGKKHPFLKGIISHIDIAPDSALWVSTPEGIAILKNEALHIITRSQGLLSNSCKHVLFELQTAWVSTDQGISRIKYQWKKNDFSFTISNIMEVDGLLSSDVNQTALGGDYIWAATEDGISFFSKQYTSTPYILPPISISRVISGNETLPLSDTITINYRKNNLLIGLFCPSYRSFGNIQYEYRLSKLDTTWLVTSNNYIEFSSLPYGQFELEVHAVNKWGQKTLSPKRIIIINTPPFWKSVWFSVILYIATFFLVGAGFYLVNRDRHRKKEHSYKITQKIRDLEIMALRSQMNPHFIFNCMSSIQYYILRTDVINANLYLHKFSALIRKTLLYSNVSTISLAEEIKQLELYLELEKMRLQERMDFQIVLSDSVDPRQLLIPPMIIQPYIENAVKHGISPLQNKKGIVTVSFDRTESYVHCIIDDNGIGINASSQKTYRAEEDHISMGTSITEHRIRTINSLQKNKILLKIFDKKDSSPPGDGTIVHLYFPVINE